ncbi:MAG: membrane protein insertion efficiency factor YidD [Alphaproteobacteria bacterium]|nr:membrane protein insertion efficiency factor YidD [Alphaproteobacteria bacterium]
MTFLIHAGQYALRQAALAALWGYRYIIWPLLKVLIPDGGCLYHPTCSAYAREAFQTLPLWRAFLLTLWRLLRCHPFARGGIDPVPPPSRKKG